MTLVVILESWWDGKGVRLAVLLALEDEECYGLAREVSTTVNSSVVVLRRAKKAHPKLRDVIGPRATGHLDANENNDPSRAGSALAYLNLQQEGSSREPGQQVPRDFMVGSPTHQSTCNAAGDVTILALESLIGKRLCCQGSQGRVW